MQSADNSYFAALRQAMAEVVWPLKTEYAGMSCAVLTPLMETVM